MGLIKTRRDKCTRIKRDELFIQSSVNKMQATYLQGTRREILREYYSPVMNAVVEDTISKKS